MAAVGKGEEGEGGVGGTRNLGYRNVSEFFGVVGVSEPRGQDREVEVEFSRGHVVDSCRAEQ